MKLNKIVLIAFVGLGVLVAFVMTMRPGLNSSDASTRLKAVEKVSDPKLLGQIAMNDEDQAVRIAAIENLTDQTVLSQIVLTNQDDIEQIDAIAVGKAVVRRLAEDRDLSAVAMSDAPDKVRQAAMKKITDQEILGATFLAITDGNVRLAGIESISDPQLLVTVALIDESENVRMAAFTRLTEQSRSQDVAPTPNSDSARKNTELMSKVFDAYDALPEEHRVRLASEILTLAHALQVSSVAAEIELVSIRPTWTEYNAEYSAGWNAETTRLKTQTKYGEKFTLEISTNIASEPLVYVGAWETYFHKDTDTMVFRPARIGVGKIILDIYQDAFEGMSQTELFEVANDTRNGGFELLAGKTAARLLTDQELVQSLASGASIDEIRRVAVGKVDDQNRLTHFARNDDDVGVRSQATRQLTDPATLTRIALSDPARSVRGTATDNLTSQGRLGRIPPSNRSQDDRLLWIERLTDQTLLAIVALEASEIEYRRAAVELLDDPATLSQISKGDDNGTIRTLADDKLNRLQD